MKLPTKQIAKILKTVGESVTLSWPSRAFGEDENKKLSTVAYIETATVAIGEGKWDRKLVATMPATKRDLKGAILTRKDGTTYKVQEYEKSTLAGTTLYQEVILV
jgi:hypothetical protein